MLIVLGYGLVQSFLLLKIHTTIDDNEEYYVQNRETNALEFQLESRSNSNSLQVLFLVRTHVIIILTPFDNHLFFLRKKN